MQHASDHSEIRDAVARLCADFPRRILAQARPRDGLSDGVRDGADRKRLPLGADPRGVWRRRPHALGGGRHHGGNPAPGLQRRRLPCPDVCDGHRTAPRYGRPETALPPEDRLGRTQASGLRRHRADQRHRHHGLAHHRPPRRRPLRRQRSEDLDEPRGAVRSDAVARPHHAARSGAEAHRRALGLHPRHARGAEGWPDHPADPHDDEPCHDRGFLRQCEGAGHEPRRRGRQGLPLHPLRHECRAHPDCGRMRRRCQMVHRQGLDLRQGSAMSSAGRSARTRASSSRSPRPTPICAPPN